jgi:phytoene synthase
MQAMPTDQEYCQQIVRTHARTFWIASRFLPPDKRRAAFAIYAFCRVADDMVDLAANGAQDDTAGQLAAYRLQLTDALAGRPTGPIFRELATATTRWTIPDGAALELIDGVARDCRPTRYTSWHELAQYCNGVASSVGEMCTYVFGVTGGPGTLDRARAYARTLGVAMQLTNILRDVGEDARNGRCYLPDEDLRRFGLDRAEVLADGHTVDDRWTALMRFEIARARTLYAQAAPGIALLAPDARRCAAACATGYAAILGAIETNGYDTFSTRARLGSVARVAVLWNAWRTPLHVARADAATDHDETHMLSA